MVRSPARGLEAVRGGARILWPTAETQSGEWMATGSISSPAKPSIVSMLRAPAALALLVTALLVLPARALAVNNGIAGVDQGLQLKARAQATILAGHLGFHLHRLHLEVGWADHPHEVPNALTGTNSAVNGHITAAGPVCEIAINRGWFKPLGAYVQDEVLLHEVFHCFEYEVTPGAHHDNDWVLEGLARWADLTLYPQTTFVVALKNLADYFDTPERTVFSRSYDAVGFWAHAQDVTGDLWQRVKQIVQDDVGGHDQAAIAAALGGSETTFLQSWGSSAFDDPSGAPVSWRPQSPLGTRLFASGHSPWVTTSTTGFELKPWSTAQIRVEQGSAPLIRLAFDGAIHGRFGIAANYVDEAATSKLYCSAAHPSECECPAGDEGKVPATVPLPAEPDLGVASDQTGGRVQVIYQTVQSGGWCKAPPSAPPVLQSSPSCVNLLPGYQEYLENLAGEVTAKAAAIESEMDGIHSSICPFGGAKGQIESFVQPGGEKRKNSSASRRSRPRSNASPTWARRKPSSRPKPPPSRAVR